MSNTPAPKKKASPLTVRGYLSPSGTPAAVPSNPPVYPGSPGFKKYVEENNLDPYAGTKFAGLSLQIRRAMQKYADERGRPVAKTPEKVSQAAQKRRLLADQAGEGTYLDDDGNEITAEPSPAPPSASGAKSRGPLRIAFGSPSPVAAMGFASPAPPARERGVSSFASPAAAASSGTPPAAATPYSKPKPKNAYTLRGFRGGRRHHRKSKKHATHKHKSTSKSTSRRRRSHTRASRRRGRGAK